MRVYTSGNRSVFPSACAALLSASLAPWCHAQLEADAPLQSTLAGHVYVNARTGERIVTPAGEPGASQRSTLDPVFLNNDSASNGNYFFGLDSPARQANDLVCWGDIALDSRVDAFEFAYATDIAPDAPPVTQGLDAVLWWYDCDNNTPFPIEFVPLYGITVSDLNGNPFSTGFGRWIYTIDLSGTGLEFEIGDTDGSYTGASGIPSTGCDRDTYPGADFGWSYRFNQGQAGPQGTIGPVLVMPLGAGIDTSIPDRFALYANPNDGVREQYVGSFWLGGWPIAPYASTYTGLYANSGADCSLADYNSDSEVDILDFLDFLDDFGGCESQPAPCGSISDADLTGDTIVDILDFLDFFEYFSVCS